jgi:ParB-like chromosome segregation protein Spo0J
MEEIPCWVQTPKDQEILVRQVVENWQRADLHPYDLADALAQMRDGLGFSQKKIAELTGKPESEISRLLSLLKVNPLIQREARQDKTGLISKRHLTAIAQLPKEDQQEAMVEIKSKQMTAIQTEKLVQETKKEQRGEAKRGAPVGAKFRYTTSAALVTIAFRKKTASDKDALAVLTELQAQIKKKAKDER